MNSDLFKNNVTYKLFSYTHITSDTAFVLSIEPEYMNFTA